MVQKMRKMKDSGIEWIGEIPEGWEVSQLKYATRWKSEKGCPDAPVLSLYRDFGVVPKDSRDDNHNVTSLDTSNYKVVDIGDLVINKMKAWQGSMAVSDYRGIVSPAYHVCSITSSKINKRYLHHLLRNPAYLPEYARLSTGMRIGQWDLGFDDFKNIPFLIPPLDEQAKIADYLDNGCASLNAMHSKTRSSIEEYKKLKQAVITQAVTKGVRGEREMKDSGVEWIGKIPEEWNKCKLKNISIDIGDGLHGTPKFDDSGEVYFINGNNFSGEYVEPKFDTKKLCLEESLNYPKPELTEQTIMISLNGSYGKVCLYRYFPMLLGKSAGYITLLPSINRRYVRYYLSSTPAQIIMTLSLNGTTIPNLSLNTLYNFPTILPPASEQAEIADYLDAKCAEIDKLIAKKEQLVKELESYKKSLIYEVVTGKREV
uniref:restriction endonuclease subunit S n=1 Tax=Segatella hominis TaxID=2518605 RepID=UPI0040290B8B